MCTVYIHICQRTRVQTTGQEEGKKSDASQQSRTQPPVSLVRARVVIAVVCASVRAAGIYQKLWAGAGLFLTQGVPARLSAGNRAKNGSFQAFGPQMPWPSPVVAEENLGFGTPTTFLKKKEESYGELLRRGKLYFGSVRNPSSLNASCPGKEEGGGI